MASAPFFVAGHPVRNMTKSSLACARGTAHREGVGLAPLSSPAPSTQGNAMTRPLATAFISLAFLVGSAAPALAAPCKDAKGKFVKCPPKAAPKKGPCKDAKGRFAKCN
ncbi:hypothetical protein [Sphingobium yanoikuyae]|uniref:hypothetical protein n=1 Tax=Sphingobium yanoikuyae TaxID=13690 RepID=UPI0028AF26F6|nr:hypothetical protein [Sphingobium yanoikuyae]